LEAVPSLDLLYFIGSNQYHVVEAVVHDEILLDIGRERGAAIVDSKIFPSDPDVIRRLDEVAGTIASEAIARRPRAYARQVAANVYGLWWLPLVQTAANAAALNGQIEAVLPRYSGLDRSPVSFRVLPLPAFVAVRAVLAMVIVGGVAGVVLVWFRDPRRATIGYVAVLLHGYVLLVSLAQPGLPRYAIAVWPASMVLLFGTLAVARSARVSPAGEPTAVP
jgi:hypothetical protein